MAPVLLCIATLGPAAQAREVIRKGDTVIIPLRGEVSPALYLFLRRGIKAAESAEASAIVIEMNTYGGRLDSAEEITGALNRVTIPTYTFIDSNAGSAGALIALATKHIYMAPVSAIGAAAPVLSTGQDLPETERDKTISYFSALVRSMASRNGHNPDLGEAFMNKEKEVKIGDRVVHAKGSLLTLNAQEASEMINGRPLLADGIAQSIDDLAKKAKLGVTLVLIEVLFFAHSTIIFGVVGAFLILASLFWAMIDRYPDQPLVPSTKMLLVPMLNLSIAIIASMIVIALLARYLPRTSFYRRIALTAANPSGPSFSAPREFVTSRPIAPGTRGLAMTTLRPSGKGKFGDQIVDVITEGEFISAETPIVVSQIDGMRVLVARTQTSS